MNTLKRPYRYVLLSAVVILLSIGAFLVFRSAQDGSPGNPSVHPQDGSYKITKVGSMVCTLKLPPDCAGSVTLSSGSGEVDATVDRGTNVRYQTREMQVYPDALAEGMTVIIAFKPGSATVDTVVIAE